jgi:glutathione S-transferase
MMKLRYNSMSPYTRKVVIVIAEAGIEDQVERIPTQPWFEFTDAHEVNPLGKIPALVLENGEVLYDSPVICEYVDSLHDGPKLFPPIGDARWTALRRLALGDGIIDTGGFGVLEERRVKAEQSPGWIARQNDAVDRCIEVMEKEASTYGDLDIGLISLAVGLGHLDFRMPDCGWRNGHPVLTKWYEEVAKRPSFADNVQTDWVPTDQGRLNTWTGWEHEEAT